MSVMHLEIVLRDAELDCDETLAVVDRLLSHTTFCSCTTIRSSAFVQGAVVAKEGETVSFVFSAKPVVVERVFFSDFL